MQGLQNGKLGDFLPSARILHAPGGTDRIPLFPRRRAHGGGGIALFPPRGGDTRPGRGHGGRGRPGGGRPGSSRTVSSGAGSSGRRMCETERYDKRTRS